MTRSKQTHTHNFTGEEIEMLRENPHVVGVTRSSVQFSKEFKEEFYRRMCSGEDANKIFRDCGIDPGVLGPDRIRNFKYVLNKYAARESGFTDKRKNNGHQTVVSRRSNADRLSCLESEVARLTKEVEAFKELLKKN